MKLMPEFSLVICDGPPASTPGGRYGLLPVMRDKLKAGATILLDDAVREEEQVIANRWAAELKMSPDVLDSERSYVRLTVPGSR